MSTRRMQRPEMPATLPERDRVAFEVYDALLAEARAAGWTLLLRLVGFGDGKHAVLELRKGVLTGAQRDVGALRECGVWRAAECLWAVPGQSQVWCTTADRLTALIRAQIERGSLNVLWRRPPAPKGTEERIRKVRFNRRSRWYLTRNENE